VRLGERGRRDPPAAEARAGRKSFLPKRPVSAAQRVEHYEIAGYGTARTLAKRLGLNGIADTPQKTLEEERAAGGFTAPKGSRKHLGAVVLGAYTNVEHSNFSDVITFYEQAPNQRLVERPKGQV
jgi:hypothetical protein